MRKRIWSCISAIAVLALLSVADRSAGAPPKEKTVRYTVVRLDTLGGTAGGGNSINNPGWVTGFANLDGNQQAHATLWREGETIDLGTLGGPNSAVGWPVKNNNGSIVGIAETGDLDPLGETFSCVPFFGTPRSGHICRGFLWRDDVMIGLDPFAGGTHSYAAGANGQGQIVGWAENGTHDPLCVSPQVLQFRAAMWNASDVGGAPTVLPPFGTDTSGSATAINDRGQVVGISGICDRAFGRFSAIHALMWEDGVPRNLGDLGGVAWNTPAALNHNGDAAGFSNTSTGTPGGLHAHAVLWPSEGGVVDLKTVDDDVISLAFGINDRRQVVGQSIGAGGSRAFLWQDGAIMDLNTLTETGSPFLVYANDINDRGEIAGQGCDDCASGATFAVQLIPVDGGLK
jgi:probable HAF family extracellular repeat protein